MARGQEFPLEAVPADERRGIVSLCSVLLGFTFFTATMWGGGKVGVAFPLWPDLVLVVLGGNLLLGLYAAGIGYAGFRAGYTSVLLSAFAFGSRGGRAVDLLLGLTQVGWYAWGTATVALVLVQMAGLGEGLVPVLMVFFGFFFCWTAYVGYRGLDLLARVTVPLMTGLILWSMALAFQKAGGWAGLAALLPTEPMPVAQALTVVFGTFASGATQVANWTRFAQTGRAAVLATLSAFFVGNGLMVASGAVGAPVYRDPDIVTVLAMQGLLGAGVFLLLANIWTTQDNTIYNFSVAGCHFFDTEHRRWMTLGGAALGTVLALLGIYDWLVPYLLFLGTYIPPVGGAILADLAVRRGGYPAAGSAPAWNSAGLVGYAVGAVAATFLPGVPPVNGVLVAFAAALLLGKQRRQQAPGYAG